MIIKLTVHDNDFTERVEIFAQDLFSKIYWYDEQKENETIEDKLEEINLKNKIQSLMNEQNQLSKEDKKFICDLVKKLWEQYIDNEKYYQPHTKDYLKNNFRVNISYNFKDKWENGENVYYFTAQKVSLTQ